MTTRRWLFGNMACILLILMASKYAPLMEHLSALPRATEEVTLTFRELESLLGFTLPKSATDYRQWWANPNPTDSRSRPQANAWIQAGFEVKYVQVKTGGSVTFRRKL